MNLKFLPKSLRITAILSLIFATVFTNVNAQYALGPEGFEGTFPPAGWTLGHTSGTSTLSCTLDWIQGTAGVVACNGSTYSGDPAAVAHLGTHCALFDSWWIQTGGTSYLISPALNLTQTAGLYQFSFWVYNYQNYSYQTDNIVVYANTSPTAGGAVLATAYPNYYGNPTASNYSTTSGWKQITVNIPSAYCTANTYIIFQGTSAYYYDLFIDDVSVAYIAPCSGTPTAPQITSAPMTPLCSGGTATISAFDPNTAGSLYNFWQTSPTGLPGSWTNIPNSDTFTYTTPVLTNTTYFRFADSCGISNQVSYSSAFTVPVNSYSIPYSENFSTTLNTQIPYCFTENITSSGQSRWQVNTTFHDALGTAYPYVMSENDVQGNYQSGKNAFFTLPALPLKAGEIYRIRFGYERGRSDANTTNIGSTYPENLYLYENYAVQPSTSSTGIPGGSAATSLFNTVVTVDGHNTASLTFTPSTNGAYFFSWYSNTPHPAGGINVAGGLIAVDSIFIDSFGCQLPVITFQPQNSAVCIGNTATLSVSATGYGLTYQWYQNNALITGATSSTLTIPNAQPINAGNYKVIVTGTCGGTTNIQSNTVTLTVSNYPTDTISTSTPTTFCPGSSVVLNSVATGGNSYQWKVNGNFIPNAFSSSYTATTSGSYQSVVTNQYGCSATSPAVPVTVLSASAITITPSGPTAFCNGGSVTLTANNTSGVHYNWLMNGAPLSPADTTTVLTTSTPGSYTIVETAYGNGCTDTFHTPVNVVVNGPTAAPAINAGGPLSFCIGGFVTLSTPNITAPVGQPAYTYQWYQNNTAISGTQAQTTSYTASASGLYTVRVTQNGCSLSSPTDTVFVDAPPTTVTNNGTIICSGNTIVLNAPAGTGLSYQWYNNGTPISGQTSQTFSTTSGGAYQVQVMDQFPPSGCTAMSSVTTVTVGAPPSAVILALGPTTFCAGSSVNIKANIDTSLNYVWSVSTSGPSGTYVTLPSASGYPNGHYDTVRNFAASGWYRVTESNGPCQNTSSPIQVTAVAYPTPTIVSSGSDSLCPGGSVTLSTQTGTGYTYQWIKDGLNIPGGITPSLIISSNSVQPGGSVIKLLVTNSTGCTGIAPALGVFNFPTPTDSITVAGSDSICLGTSDTLYASAGLGYKYQWRLNGSVLPGDTLQAYAATAAGTYTVDVVSNVGCIASTANPATIHVLPLPSTNVVAGSSTTFCTGGSVTLCAAAGSGLTYQWQTMVGANLYNISGANSACYTDTASGIIRVVISNGVCAVGSIATQVTVNTPPPVNITASGPTTICAGNTVTLSASTVPGATYQWKINNNNINANGNLPSYSANQSGSYTVVATTSNCTSASSPITVKVNPLPMDSVELSNIPGNRNPTCEGTPAILDDKNGIPSFAYHWMWNGADIPGATLMAYDAIDSGIYNFRVTDTNTCTNTSLNSIHVALWGLPNPSVNIAGSTLSTGTFVTYQWLFNDVDIPGATANAYTATQSGKYSVRVTDGHGCSNTSSEFVVNNVGVNNVTKSDIHIYPNPVTSVVHIDAPVKVSVVISGLDGKKIIQVKDATEIDLSGLANGVYMITVYDENNNMIKVDKLVKTNS